MNGTENIHVTHFSIQYCTIYLYLWKVLLFYLAKLVL